MIVEHAAGLTWVEDAPMGRASHAIGDSSIGIWLVDPVADDEALARARNLGDVRGVIQLLDRHPRDGRSLASRFGVPLYEMPVALPSTTPFAFIDVMTLPVWRESALWWPEKRVLAVAEILGTSISFRLGPGEVGVHPMVRLAPPTVLKRFNPETLLFGHGAPVSGPGTTKKMHEAYAASRRDLLRVPAKLPDLLRVGRDFRP